MKAALAGSIVLHALAGVAIWPHAAPPPAPVQAPPVEVELIQQPEAVAGAQPQPGEGADAQQAPQPRETKGEAAPTETTPSRSASQAAVHLGTNRELMEGMFVTGEHVVPPRPNATYRNRPPRYPLEAARRGEEGTVSLLVHVSATGLPEWVQVGLSSGSSSLDQAAVEAVRLWHFNPAIDGDRPVPFDYEMNVNFVRDRR